MTITNTAPASQMGSNPGDCDGPISTDQQQIVRQPHQSQSIGNQELHNKNKEEALKSLRIMFALLTTFNVAGGVGSLVRKDNISATLLISDTINSTVLSGYQLKKFYKDFTTKPQNAPKDLNLFVTETLKPGILGAVFPTLLSLIPNTKKEHFLLSSLAAVASNFYGIKDFKQGTRFTNTNPEDALPPMDNHINTAFSLAGGTLAMALQSKIIHDIVSQDNQNGTIRPVLMALTLMGLYSRLIATVHTCFENSARSPSKIYPGLFEAGASYYYSQLFFNKDIPQKISDNEITQILISGTLVSAASISSVFMAAHIAQKAADKAKSYL